MLKDRRDVLLKRLASTTTESKLVSLDDRFPDLVYEIRTEQWNKRNEGSKESLETLLQSMPVNSRGLKKETSEEQAALDDHWRARSKLVRKLREADLDKLNWFRNKSLRREIEEERERLPIDRFWRTKYRALREKAKGKELSNLQKFFVKYSELEEALETLDEGDFQALKAWPNLWEAVDVERRSFSQFLKDVSDAFPELGDLGGDEGGDDTLESGEKATALANAGRPATTLRSMLFRDFGKDFQISGGFGNSIENSIVIHKVVPNDYTSVEYGVLGCICIGRNVEWKLIRSSLISEGGKMIDQLKIQTISTSDAEVVTQVENFYFDITECYGH